MPTRPRPALPRTGVLGLAAALVTGMLGASPVAATLLVNGGFDGNTAGWQTFSEPGRYTTGWQIEDASGDPSSGSLRITHLGDAAVDYAGAAQCVAVEPGETYPISAHLRVAPGQSGTGAARVLVQWATDSDCQSFIAGAVALAQGADSGWSSSTNSLVAPAGAHGALVQLAVRLDVAGTTLAAEFDDIAFGAAEPPPEPPFSTWIQGDLDDFEAQVRITSDDTAVEGGAVADCIAETICAHGQLAARPEVFIKVIGPRPNGHLWAQIVRFTPSRVEIWLRQQSTGEVRYYELDAVPPGAGVLSGLEDREAFLP